MPSDSPIRKLTAIFYADVAGYSRLTGDDEFGTHQRVMARLDRASDLLQQSGGVVLRYAGDAILGEFPSVVAAVETAIRIQKALHELNLDESGSEPVQIRIGIHLGEVLQDRGEIFGDGVNIAARLESIAIPEGICISSNVHEQVEGKISEQFVSGGTREFKNIHKPMAVWHWSPYGVGQSPQTLSSLGASREPSLPLIPSIAVLAFENMSSDPDQEFFADGISEDIITQLSKFRSFFVIARNSSFSFKGQPQDIKEVSKKLGVRYIVEGSVRRAGNRVRITAQLIDAVEDKHLWADKYDRNMEDIFAVQDEVTESIVTTIAPTLLDSERSLALRKPTENLNAWECYQRGLWHIYQYTREDGEQAMSLLERAVKLDPNFASAYGGIAFSMYVYVLMNNSRDDKAYKQKGLEAGKMAVQLDDKDPFAHTGLGRIRIIRGEHEEAIESFNRAIELNPSFALAYYGKAHSQWHCGQADQSVINHDEAIRLSPSDPLMWTFLASKAIALALLKRYDEALECSLRAQRYPMSAIWAHMGELCVLGYMGRAAEADEALKKALLKESELSIEFVDRCLPITHEQTRQFFHKGLIAAGMPLQ